MAEHVHEWTFPELAPAGIKNFAWCDAGDGYCEATLSVDDVKRRLNATARLNGNLARAAIWAAGDRFGTSLIDPLEAYASALSGDSNED